MIQKISATEMTLERPMSPKLIQNPFGFFKKGISSKFMPKIPLISVSGMNSAVSMVSTVTISFVLCAVAEK